MISNKFTVNSDAERMAAARYATENFAWQLRLDKRDALRLNLLVEETLGMVKAMVEDFYGQLWFAGEGKRCEIHLQATADMDADKKQELLSVSSSGKNASTRGFMAMLGEVISGAVHNMGRNLEAYGQETVRYGIVHSPGFNMVSPDGLMPIWSLQAFKDELNREREEDEAAEAYLEDLEKSIVARLADDVVVGVKGDRIELVITKSFGE